VAEDLDTVSDSGLLVDAAGEQGFVVLDASLGNKSKGNKGKKQ
jgi:hypothetical protein